MSDAAPFAAGAASDFALGLSALALNAFLGVFLPGEGAFLPVFANLLLPPEDTDFGMWQDDADLSDS